MKKIIKLIATITMLVGFCFGLVACDGVEEQELGTTQGTECVVYAVVDGEAWVLGYDGTDSRVEIAETYNNAPVTTIVGYAFKNSTITSVVIPDSVTNIGYGAFYACKSLLYAEIGNGVTTMGGYAFSGCTALKVVKMSDCAMSIGAGAFYDCTSLMVAEMSNSVTSIGEYAFNNCDSLTSIMIPDSVTSIGDYVFYDSDRLTSVVIGKGVTSIGDYAFYDCNSLTTINYRGTQSQWSLISKGWSSVSSSCTIIYNYTGE